jgi:hypothetical protein
MSHIGSGREARTAPGTTTSAYPRGSARRARAASRSRRRVMLRIGFGLLLSRQFHELVIAGVIGLAALAGLARENQARARTRLAAWDKRQNLRYERTVKARPV